MKDYEIIEYLFWRIVLLMLLSPFIFFGLIIILMILLHAYWFSETIWGQITYPSIDYLVQNYENKNDVFEIVVQEAIRDCEQYGLKNFHFSPQWLRPFYRKAEILPTQNTSYYNQALLYLDIESFSLDQDCKSVSFIAGTKFDDYRHISDNHYTYTREYFYSTEEPESMCSDTFKNITTVFEKYNLIMDLNNFKPNCDSNYHLYQKLDEDWYLYDGRFWNMIRVP